MIKRKTKTKELEGENGGDEEKEEGNNNST